MSAATVDLPAGTTRTVRVLGTGLDPARIHELMPGPSPLARVRRLLGGRLDEQVRIGPQLYWPIALVHATARSTGRRQWIDRVQGAIDLVTGRVGLVDLEIPPSREIGAREVDCIPARVGRSSATALWHEYFRDHVDRQRKPLRPPELSIDRMERVWLPNHVVTTAGRDYLVDAMVGRADDLRNYPVVEQMLGVQSRADSQGANR